MANDLNQCNFIGNLGKDVECRFMPSGDAIANFPIAVGSTWKDKSGVKQDATEWVNITVFGKLAEICREHLKKGSKVFISGRMKTEKYTDKEGIERYSTKIIADRMQMLDGKPRGDEQSAPQQRSQSVSRSQSANTAARPAPNFSDLDDFSGDVPF